MAILFLSDAAVFMDLAFDRNAVELRRHGAVATILERHADPVADAHGQRVFADHVGHHAWPFIEFDQRDNIWRTSGERRHRRAANDRKAMDAARAFAVDPLEPV